MGIFAIIQLIIGIIGAIPTIIKIIQEIFAMLKGKPLAVQMQVKSEIKSALMDCQTARALGQEPNHELLTQKLQGILETLKP